MTKITAIEGIGVTVAKKLAKAGVKSAEGLLKTGATKKGRKELAATTGLDEKKILTWVNCADLFRIKGISTQYSELLEAAGVDTVPELSKRKPENLHAKMLEVNSAGKKSLVRQPPSVKQVTDWVTQAKSLPKMVTH